MSTNPKTMQDAGVRLLELAQLYKEFRSELTDKAAFKLAILGNPELGECYTGQPIRNDAVRAVTEFLVNGGPLP